MCFERSSVVVFCLVCVVVRAATSDFVSRFETFTLVPRQELQLVTVHHHSGDVYVGGTNVLLHLASNLTLRQKPVTTGPYLDTDLCSPSFYGCTAQRQLTDTQSKVLLVDYELNRLLFCGSTHQGMCQVMLVDDCSQRWGIGEEDNVVNYVAGKQSVVGFFARGPWPIRSPVLYVAATYDDRPFNLSAPQLSSRRIWREGGRYTFKMTYDDGDRRSAVSFTDAAKKSYFVEYVHGFVHGNFSYLVTVQKLAPQSHEIESRLVRIHLDDMSFYSYTEMPLKCQQGTNTIYNLATAAQLGKGSDETRRLHAFLEGTGGDDEDRVLYVTFARTVPGGTSMLDESKGSALCAFPMKDVVAAFTKAIADCYNRESNARRATWIVEGAKCQRAKVNIDPNFSGSSINSYVEGSSAIAGVFIEQYNLQLSSLALTVQNDVVVGVLGTRDGTILKIKLNNFKAEVIHTLSIADDLPERDRSVSKSVAFDPNEKSVYLLTGNRVTKYPIGSCSIYGDCQSCISSGADPLECGWCGSSCTLREECKSGFQKDRCSPSIVDFDPKMGPIDGGTLVNITGKNFGSSSAGSGGSLTVLIGLEVCEIISWQNDRIICSTRAVSSPIKNVLKISASDKTKLSTGYFIEGETYSYGKVFEYVKPSAVLFSPRYGPMAGGTNVTISGKYLSVGTKAAVRIGGVDCAIYFKSLDSLECTTSKFEGPPYSAKRVEVSIDNAVFNASLQSSFKYVPNPVVEGIEPNSAPLSGGRNIAVSGEYLDSVSAPKMVVIITIPITGKVIKLLQDCVSLSSRRLVCVTPDITPIKDTLQIPHSAHLSFVMDGAFDTMAFARQHRALSQFTFYPDPVVKPFVGERQEKIITSDLNALEIEGENLNLVYDESDVSVIIDGDSSCVLQEMTTNRIICKLPKLEPTETNAHKVVVTMGNSSFNVGYLLLSVPLAKDESGVLPLAIAIAVGAFFIVVILLILWRWRAARRKSLLHSNMMVTFRNRADDDAESAAFSIGGGGASCGGSQRTRDYYGNDYYSVAGAHPKANLMNGAHVSDETMQLLRAEEILIARDFLDIGDVIGQGHFGRVYQGQLNYPGKPDPIGVAVKTLNTKDPMTEQTVNDFLNEGLMMKDFHHINVLSLIGVCFEEDGMPIVIIPFMRHGDLLSYIRDDNNYPTVKDLLNFGIQIAEGMQYLSELKFVHRDLAARNCMLDEGLTVKVADFGLSRDVYESAYYCSENKKTKLPVKWMAIESLEKGQYSIKSDVWSYGVVLWELMTRGVNPYPEVDNWDIVKFLTSNRRMPQPSYCPTELYEIMLTCWREDPHERPVFSELVSGVRSVIKVMERRSQLQKVGLDVTYVNYPRCAAADDGCGDGMQQGGDDDAMSVDDDIDMNLASIEHGLSSVRV